MNNAIMNSLFFLVPFVVDQVTKNWAIKELVVPWPVFPFLKFELFYNRGVTWGLFNADGYFSIVTLVVIAVALMLIVSTLNSFKQGKDVRPQLLILSGAASNILDRIVHSGVVDFITVHFGSWYWPTFNIADVCIVLGVFWMFISYEE
jgi:signal peptidase II